MLYQDLTTPARNDVLGSGPGVGDGPVVIGGDPDILENVRSPGIHLAVWRRVLPGDLGAVANLDWAVLDDIDREVAADLLAAELPRWLDEAGYAAVTPVLAREIAMLAERLAAITACDRLRVRLEVIETDACRRFHSDHVTVRLLMPLFGAGTQWRRADGHGPVDALRVGDVGLFKGRRWADEPVILHRSPPIEAAGETRLLLTLDPLDGDRLD